MARKATAYYHNVPSFIETCNNKYELATALHMSGCEKGYGKLKAAHQRQLVGHPVFGKKDMYYDVAADNTVAVYTSMCFGTDGEVQRYTMDEVIEAGREGRRLN